MKALKAKSADTDGAAFARITVTPSSAEHASL